MDPTELVSRIATMITITIFSIAGIITCSRNFKKKIEELRKGAETSPKAKSDLENPDFLRGLHFDCFRSTCKMFFLSGIFWLIINPSFALVAVVSAWAGAYFNFLVN